MADHTIVSSGGIQNDDGTATNTSLGGTQIVFAGAVASGTTISSGGYEYVLPGGVTSGTLASGGFLNDDGAAYGTRISSGSEEIVFSGASESGSTVYAGGFEVVVSGGTTTSGDAERGLP